MHSAHAAQVQVLQVSVILVPVAVVIAACHLADVGEVVLVEVACNFQVGDFEHLVALDDVAQRSGGGNVYRNLLGDKSGVIGPCRRNAK